MPHADEPLVPLRPPFVDERGEILNLIEAVFASAVVIRSVAGAVRAQHYHKTDYHYCWLQEGEMHYFQRPVGETGPAQRWRISAGQVFFTPPMHEHAMVFTKDSVMLVFARNSRQMERYEEDTVRVRIPGVPGEGTAP
ncbi:MAG TPA: hypothetical protein VGB20_02840 [bacterium]